MKSGIPLALAAGLLISSPCFAEPGDVSASGFIESTSGGFIFPDGSVQLSAVAPSEAWPQHCYHAGSLESGETLDLTCYSHIQEPGGTWGSSSGVTAGYYFLVTDVLIESYTDGVKTVVTLTHSYPGGNLLSRKFRLSPTGDSKLYSFVSPTMHLPEEHWLKVSNSGASSVKVDVMGWLTNNPAYVLH